jgi:NAD(P) transhydrogenase subunit alpha
MVGNNNLRRAPNVRHRNCIRRRGAARNVCPPTVPEEGAEMLVGVPKETSPGECRVALTPATARQLIQSGVIVRCEAGAGEPAGYGDDDYRDRGVIVAASRPDVFAADILLQVRTPGANPATGAADLAALRRGQVLVGFADALTAHDATRAVCQAGVTLFALELIPRLTRAQAMDALSSQANLAGYRAVLLAAFHLRKIFPLMTTAAGTLQPARILVLGAGVAGLQAIATARRLGAVVSAFDVRPGVAEQVRSLGARFVALPAADGEAAGGYAREQSAEQLQQQQALLAPLIAEADVVLTTAAVPGRRAPILVTAAAIEGMRPGSVVVDLAADRGGNCALTQADRVVQAHGVTVLGPTNLPSEVAYHASQAYATNLVNLLRLMLKEARLDLDQPDAIVAGCLVCRDGTIVHPQVRQALGLPPLAPASFSRE